jgi:hypothetical protein
VPVPGVDLARPALLPPEALPPPPPPPPLERLLVFVALPFPPAELGVPVAGGDGVAATAIRCVVDELPAVVRLLLTR